jgi:uncharacterized protein YjiS (DUF1127 family)
MNLSKDTYLISGDQQKLAWDVSAWLSSIRGRLHRAGVYWAERRTRAREMRELHRFSDRELWDIGLSRSDLLGIEQGIYRRD